MQNINISKLSIEEILNKPTLIIDATHDATVKAAELIKRGELVVCPTETVYGLCADALNPDAVRKIFQAKGRPSDNPLILHVSSMEMIEEMKIAQIPEQYRPLIDRYWPGPLTIILPRGPSVGDGICGERSTVAVRIPSHKIMRDLIDMSGCVIAAPSANTSGKPSPTSAEHAYDDLDGKISLILDGGKAKYGIESTVVNMLEGSVTILRPGSITKEMIEAIYPEYRVQICEIHEKPDSRIFKMKKSFTDFPEITEYPEEDVPIAPGMKYKHYAPNAPVTVLNLLNCDHKKVFEECKKHKNPGTITRYSLWKAILKEDPDGNHLAMGDEDEDIEGMARDLFWNFRELDKKNVDQIIIHDVSMTAVGAAFLNRLYKAASK